MFKVIIIFFCSLIITLVITTPAKWLYDKSKSNNDPLILSQIKGSIWSGSTSVFAPLLYPQYRAENWEWEFKLKKLLKAQLSWQFSHKKSAIKGSVAVDIFALGKEVELILDSDIKSLSSINPIFSLVSGQFQAQLNNFQTVNCKSNSGHISLKNISFSGVSLDQLNTLISCTETGAFKLDYNSKDKATKINGTITIDSRGYYQSSMTASSTNNEVSQQLENISTKTLSKGNFLIQGRGQL